MFGVLALDHAMMANAVLGSSIGDRDRAEALKVRGLVNYIGGFHDSYSWNSGAVRSLSYLELTTLYSEQRGF